MSKDEASDKTLRELVRQSLTEIEQHRKDSEEYRNSTSVLLAKIMVHGEYTQKALAEHDAKIEVLDAYKNKSYGVIAIIGLIFGTIAGWLVSLVSKS
jgi:hypothetical protein